MSKEAYDPLPNVAKGAHIEGYDMYKKLYDRSISDPAGFWAEKAREMLHWYRDFDIPCMGNFDEHDISWFINGTLNASANCLDRHIPTRGDQVCEHPACGVLLDLNVGGSDLGR